MTPCQARRDQFETRCTACGVRWDNDDEPACPRKVAERAHDERQERSARYIATVRRYCGTGC